MGFERPVPFSVGFDSSSASGDYPFTKGFSISYSLFPCCWRKPIAFFGNMPSLNFISIRQK
jgi:hypothetical protein